MSLQNVVLNKNSQTKITVLCFCVYNYKLVTLIYADKNYINGCVLQKGVGKGGQREKELKGQDEDLGEGGNYLDIDTKMVKCVCVCVCVHVNMIRLYS